MVGGILWAFPGQEILLGQAEHCLQRTTVREISCRATLVSFTVLKGVVITSLAHPC